MHQTSSIQLIAILGFDYLNDNLASNEEGKFLRPFDYVIIDEIDDILLDSAQTPLIIAGARGFSLIIMVLLIRW